MVFNCACCETEVISNHELCYVRKINGRNERREPAEILLSILHGKSLRGGYPEGREEKGSVSDKKNEEVQQMRFNGESATSSLGRRHQEQRSIEPGSALPEVSQITPQDNTTGYVRSLLERIFSAQEAEQDLFCPVCEGVGAHKCEKEMGKRAGMLKAYGNCINVEAAKTFIEATI
jgi:hypothetical protein